MSDTIEAVASAASKTAEHVNTREAHVRALDLRHQAAGEMRARGDEGRAAHHQKWADHHAKKAKKLGASSPSTSTAKSGAPSTDTPTEGNQDPLTTWASTPRGG